MTGRGSWAVQSWAGRRGWPGHLWCPLWRSPSWLSLSSPAWSPACNNPCRESSFPLRVRRNNKHAKSPPPLEMNVNHQLGPLSTCCVPPADVMRFRWRHVFGEQMLDNQGRACGLHHYGVVYSLPILWRSHALFCFLHRIHFVCTVGKVSHTPILVRPLSCCVSAESQTSAGGSNLNLFLVKL